MYKSNKADNSVMDLIAETFNLISWFCKGYFLSTWMETYYLASVSQLSYASEKQLNKTMQPQQHLSKFGKEWKPTLLDACFETSPKR